MTNQHDHSSPDHDPSDCSLGHVSRIATGILDESTPDEWLREACATLSENIAKLPEYELAEVGSKLFHPSLSGSDDSRLGLVQSILVTEIGIRRIFDGL